MFDVNVRVGPSGIHGELALHSAGLLEEMDRFGIRRAIVSHWTAEEYDAEAGHRALEREGLIEDRQPARYILHREETTERIVGRVLDKGVLVGIDPESDGLARARRMGVAATDKGVDGLLEMPEWKDVEIVFDATSAKAHIRTAHPGWPETGIQGTLANFEVRSDGTVAPWLTFDRHIAVLHGLWDHHPSARYPAVHAPVLLVPVDGHDHEQTARKRRDVEAALAALPNARSVWFEGDHDIHAQRPDELADVMRQTTINGFFR